MNINNYFYHRLHAGTIENTWALALKGGPIILYILATTYIEHRHFKLLLLYLELVKHNQFLLLQVSLKIIAHSWQLLLCNKAGRELNPS